MCDVRDVAFGILAAIEKGETGKNYILGGHNLSYFDGWTKFAQITGSRKPIGKLGPLIRRLAGGCGDAWGCVTGSEPDVNSAAIAISSQVHYYDSQNAADNLGYRIRPAEEIITDAWNWFQTHGYVA